MSSLKHRTRSSETLDLCCAIHALRYQGQDCGFDDWIDLVERYAQAVEEEAVANGIPPYEDD